MKTKITILFFLIIVLSCKEKRENDALSKSAQPASNAAVQVTLEGKSHTMQQAALLAPIATIKNDTLMFLLREEGNPVQINFNLFNTGILDKGNGIYKIPRTDHTYMVDLNFFNKKRKTAQIDKRIVFKKGTITITKLTKHQLNMTFEGEGNGMFEKEDTIFPIQGKININY